MDKSTLESFHFEDRLRELFTVALPLSLNDAIMILNPGLRGHRNDVQSPTRWPSEHKHSRKAIARL
jgi:hypothetical protein